MFFDPLFTTSEANEQRRIEDLCNMILCCRLDIRYIVEMRADVILQLPERLLTLMLRSGCAQFNLGLEKGSDKTLQTIMKDITVEDHFLAVERLRRLAKKARRKLLINGTFILGGPGETQADIRDTIIHSAELDLDEVTVYHLEIYPGTQTYQQAIHDGTIEPGLDPFLNESEYPLYATENLPRPFLTKVTQLHASLIHRMDELKGVAQEIEGQFLAETERGISLYPTVRTKRIFRTISVFKKTSLDFLRAHPMGTLQESWTKEEPIKANIEKVNKTIDQLEKELTRRYPDYEKSHSFDDYQPGSLMTSWRTFLKTYQELFLFVQQPCRH